MYGGKERRQAREAAAPTARRGLADFIVMHFCWLRSFVPQRCGTKTVDNSLFAATQPIACQAVPATGRALAWSLVPLPSSRLVFPALGGRLAERMGGVGDGEMGSWGHGEIGRREDREARGLETGRG
jgi:hypothetical protein